MCARSNAVSAAASTTRARAHAYTLTYFRVAQAKVIHQYSRSCMLASYSAASNYRIKRVHASRYILEENEL